MLTEWRTQIVVWQVDDRTKAGDSRYWWTAEEVGQLRRMSAPEHAHRLTMAGRPKGQSLAQLRRQLGGDEGVIFEGIRFSLAPWKGADPQRTRLIISHTRDPTGEEVEKAWRAAPLPPEVDDLRRDWIEAKETGDEAEPMLREQLDEELEALGRFRLGKVSAFDGRNAVELMPGVFVQDERYGSQASPAVSQPTRQ